MKPNHVLFALAFVAVSVWSTAAAVAQDAEDISFDDVKLELEKNEDYGRDVLTDRVLELEGKRVVIRGYMLPSFQRSGIEKFVLVRDNQECCFGPGAKLYDSMIVMMAEGESVEYSTRPIALEGTFRVKAMKLGGTLAAIYQLKDARLR